MPHTLTIHPPERSTSEQQL